MSEKPAVSRVGGRLHLNEPAKPRVRLFSEQHHEDPKHILAEVKRGLPIGRLFLRLIEIEVPEVQNGRVSEDATFKARYTAINKAVAQYDQKDAKGIASAISATAEQLDISTSTACTIFYGRAGKSGKREGGAGRAYWEPLNETDRPETTSSPQEPMFKDD